MSTQDDPQQQEQNLNIRVALSDAYAAVEGAKTNQSFNAVTFEELANAQILAISGPDTQSRPNQLNAIQQVVNNLTKSVAQIKAMPDDAFVEPDDQQDVNTPP